MTSRAKQRQKKGKENRKNPNLYYIQNQQQIKGISKDNTRNIHIHTHKHTYSEQSAPICSK